MLPTKIVFLEHGLNNFSAARARWIAPLGAENFHGEAREKRLLAREESPKCASAHAGPGKLVLDGDLCNGVQRRHVGLSHARWGSEPP